MPGTRFPFDLDKDATLPERLLTRSCELTIIFFTGCQGLDTSNTLPLKPPLDPFQARKHVHLAIGGVAPHHCCHCRVSCQKVIAAKSVRVRLIHPELQALFQTVEEGCTALFADAHPLVDPVEVAQSDVEEMLQPPD